MFLSEPLPGISPVYSTYRLQRVHPVINNSISAEFLATDEDNVNIFSLLIGMTRLSAFVQVVVKAFTFGPTPIERPVWAFTGILGD
jgi:hypothetical protein